MTDIVAPDFNPVGEIQKIAMRTVGSVHTNISRDMHRAYSTLVFVDVIRQRIEIRCYKMLRAYGSG